MIAACAHGGEYAKARAMFDGMPDHGCQPDAVTYANLIRAYKKGGQWCAFGPTQSPLNPVWYTLRTTKALLSWVVRRCHLAWAERMARMQQTRSLLRRQQFGIHASSESDGAKLKSVDGVPGQVHRAGHV